MVANRCQGRHANMERTTYTPGGGEWGRRVAQAQGYHWVIFEGEGSEGDEGAGKLEEVRVLDGGRGVV